ncbi:AhpC/TSA family protein [Flavobacteriales bacterium]|nr:AhpC/TSA family protein [Flavobacteriales bacterium]
MSDFSKMIPLFQLVLSVMLLSCGDTPQTSTNVASSPEKTTGKMHIEATVQGAPNDFAKILGVYGNQNFIVDSARSGADGVFVFDADTLLPKGFYYVMLGSDNSYFQLLLADDQEFKLSAQKGDYVNSMAVSGCLDNELLYQNLKFEGAFNSRLKPVTDKLTSLTEGTPEYASQKAKQDALIAERLEHINSFSKNHPDSYFTKFKLSGQNPELTYPKNSDGSVNQAAQVYKYRTDFWNMIDFSQTSALRTPVFANKLRKYIRELTPQNADSLIKYSDELIEKARANKEVFKYVVNWIALEYKTPKTMGTEAVFVHMIDTYWTEDQAFWSNPEEIKGLRGEISLMKPSLIGKIGQDISAKNQNGEAVSLYGLTSPIKVLFIYSYDCEHCQKEAPEMVSIYNQWKNQGVDVFALSTDKDETKWKSFIQKNNMTFKNALDPERSSKYERKYHIDITPELYVLDKDNKIIASNLSPNQLPQFLEAERGRNPW